MVNGEPRGNIVPTRGLRQGNPLSPYLFLLCFEGFNGLIHNAVNEGKINGFSLRRGGPKISHIFFANDSLLFCHAKVEEVKSIQTILEVYEKASSQQINAEKTTLFFEKPVREETKNSIKLLLDMPEIKHYEKYLGLPAVVGKNRRASLNYIKDRVWGKLQWVEGEIIIISGEGSALEGGGPSYFHFCNGMLQTPN